MQLIKDKRKDKVGYAYFYDNILSFVVGRKVWRKAVKVDLVTKVASVGDEAMALLFVENSWEVWRERFRMKYGLSKDDEAVLTVPLSQNSTNDSFQTPPKDARFKKVRDERRATPKYTKSGGGKQGRHKGWTDEGLARFNVLYREVRKDRAAHAEFDEEYSSKKKTGHDQTDDSPQDSGKEANKKVRELVETEFSDDEDNLVKERNRRKRCAKRLRKQQQEGMEQQHPQEEMQQEELEH